MAKIQRTRCNNTMTEAQLKARIMSFLRKGSLYWMPKQECAKQAKNGFILNPKTGRQNMAYECCECKKLFSKNDIKIDHIEPVVPLDGWGDQTTFLGVNWSEYIERMFVEINGLQAVCVADHKVITDAENKERRENKKRKETK